MSGEMHNGSLHMMIPADKTLIQADWGTAVSNVYTLPSVCKGAMVAYGGTDGVLEVHARRDDADTWFLLPLYAGYLTGFVFDKIRTTNTTVTLSEVTCFPV